MQPLSSNVVSSNIFIPWLVPMQYCQHPPVTNPPNSQPVFEDTEYVNLKDPSILLNLQVLVSQLLDIPGVTSFTVRKLLLRNLPGVPEASTEEKIISHAKTQIFNLTKSQLLVELENMQRISGYIFFHEHCHSIPAILEPIKLNIEALQKLINQRINQKSMENQGLGKSSRLEERVLTLKTNEELVELLNALRQKEYQGRVDLNFAPYRGQRIVAENHLKCIRRKISQVEDEFEKREKRQLYSQPGPCKRELYFDAFYC